MKLDNMLNLYCYPYLDNYLLGSSPAMDKCPTHFYRYRSLSAGAAEYVERTICHNELYFAKPSSFNDPFDCRPSFLFEASDEELMFYYNRLFKKYKPQLNRDQRRREAKSMLSDWERNPRNPEAFKWVQQQHTERITEQIGVLCLSGVKDDILMWSHYADSHRGICLEFDGYFKFFANTQEVKYPPTRPRINPFRQDQNEMMEIALLAKAKHWKYEQEWRLIQYIKGSGVYRFPPEALTGVIIGAQISPDDKEKVFGWLKRRSHPVKVYRSLPCNKNFSINIDEVSLASLRT
jgi:hypothetical protein